MKSAMELIQEIDALSAEDQKQIRDYLIAKNDDDVIFTKYSADDMAILDEEQERSQNRMDVEEYHSMDEARKALRSL